MKFDNYIAMHPDSVFAKNIIHKTHIKLLEKTPLKFKEILCNTYMEK